MENYSAAETLFFSVQLVMAELLMQTPSECIPSQLNGASSELPLTGSDATLQLSQSLYAVLSFTVANDALALCLSFLFLSSLLSLTGVPAFPTPPPFSAALQASCFSEAQHGK